jgi:hypothetical protein
MLRGEFFVKYAILYTDLDGESHFKDGELEFEPVNFAPPAPPVELTSYIQASRLVFFRLPSGWFGDWHPAPRRQFFCCLSGEFEFTTTDGETRVFGPGEVFLLEDTWGKGHKSRIISTEDFVAAIVQLAQ